LCESIVEVVVEKAMTERFNKVRSIRLEIGKLSCAEPEAMQFAFASVSRETIAEGAQLLIERPPGIAWCAHCRHAVEIEQRYDACPDCNACPLEIRGGEAMRIVNLEVE